MTSHPSILMLDDSLGEAELFRLALVQTGLEAPLFTEQDPEAALHFLKAEAQAEVKLILLDWRLRNQIGDAFLKQLKADPRLAAVPVVVFTTSDDARDMAAAYAAGANGYVVKPGTFDDLVQCVTDIYQYWIVRNRVGSTVEARC